MERMSDIPKLDYKPPSIWGSVEEIPLFIYMGIGAFLALFTSEQVLTNSPMLKAYADWMASIVPSIDPIARISSFPEVSKFFFSVMWLGMPIVGGTYYWIKILPTFYKWNIPKNVDYSLKNVLLMIAFFVLTWLISYKLLTHINFGQKDITYTGGRGRAFLSMMSQNRLALALIGTFITTMVAVIFSFTLGLVTNLFVRIRLFIFPIK